MGSKIDDLVHVPGNLYTVRVVVMFQVNRSLPQTQAADHELNVKADVLRQYLSVLPAAEQRAIVVWEHMEFSRPDGIFCVWMVCSVINRGSTVYAGAIVGPS